MRQRFFHTISSVSSANKFERDSRVEVFYKTVQGWGRIIPSLDLYRDNLTVLFNQELNFMLVVWFIVIQRVSPFEQALGNDVFIDTAACVAFNCIVKHSQFRFLAIHTTEKPRVINVQLKLIFI